MKRCKLGDMVVILESMHPENVGAFGTIIGEQFAGRLTRMPNGDEFMAEKDGWVVQARAAEGFVCMSSDLIGNVVIRTQRITYPYGTWPDSQLHPIRPAGDPVAVETETDLEVAA